MPPNVTNLVSQADRRAERQPLSTKRAGAGQSPAYRQETQQGMGARQAVDTYAETPTHQESRWLGRLTDRRIGQGEAVGKADRQVTRGHVDCAMATGAKGFRHLPQGFYEQPEASQPSRAKLPRLPLAWFGHMHPLERAAL